MRVIVKKGGEHLFLEGCHFDKDIHNKTLIVNLNKRWEYKTSKFKDNHLVIELNDGIVDLTFSSEVKDIIFDYQEKDQLLFNVIK